MSLIKKCYLFLLVLGLGCSSSLYAYSLIETTSNLLVNPGAEDGIAGWQSTGAYSVYSNATQVGAYGPRSGGFHFYSAGSSAANQSAAFSQTIDLSSYGITSTSTMDVGGVFYGYSTRLAYAALIVLYIRTYDNIGTQLSEQYYLLWDWPMSIANPYADVSYTLSIPEEAASASFVLSMFDGTYSATQYGMDNMFFILNDVYDESTPDQGPVPEPLSIICLGASIMGLLSKKIR